MRGMPPKSAAVIALLALAAAQAQAQTVILYAHADSERAEWVRGLARTYDLVLIDADIRPGEAWRQTVAGWIANARTIFILWSAAAAQSIEVGAEWRQALASGARVVPIMLDWTPLPGELAARQAVDWR